MLGATLTSRPPAILRIAGPALLALLATLARPSPAVAQAGDPCHDAVSFFATFGDGNHIYDPTGGVDRFASYPYPGNFLTWLRAVSPGTGFSNSDEAYTPNRNYPFALSVYEPFDSSKVAYAILRFDVQYEQRANNLGDTIQFFDNAKGQTAASDTFMAKLDAKLHALGQTSPQWVSILMDLKSSQVYAYRTDDFGNPASYLGVIGTLASGQAQAILDASSDGNLQGVVTNDTRLSYVAGPARTYR